LEKSAEQLRAEESINLKDPALAAFLAWLIPGLGHLYQGRLAKAALFFVCIMGTFLYGLYLGSSNGVTASGRKIGWGRVVYFSWKENHKRLHYICQVGVGLPALPAVVQAWRVKRGKPVWWNGFMAPPRFDASNAPADPNDPNWDQPTEDELHKELHRYFELGSVFTMIAGLLNVLAVYDAWGGPVFSAPPRKKEEEEDKEEMQAEKQEEKKEEEKKEEEKKEA
jgi:hypothetical protein